MSAPSRACSTSPPAAVGRVKGLPIRGVCLVRANEPPSLVALKTLVAQRLPRVELPELQLEVQAWTGFASDFTHANEHGARADDLPISVCATLLAEARNVGLEPLVRQRSRPSRALDWRGSNRTICGPIRSPTPMPVWSTRTLPCG
jgi:hypothetical protein